MISDGFIPTSLENLFRLLIGIWYFVASLFLLMIGITLVIKRRFPVFFTKRKVGFFIFFLGILLFTHITTFDRLLINPAEQSIMKSTLDHFTAYFNNQGVSNQLGGGLIGGLLFTISHYLFSTVGAKIVAVFSVLIGIIFMTNLSIGNLYIKGRKKMEKSLTQLKANIKANREQKQANKKQANEMKTEDHQALQQEFGEEPFNVEDEIDVAYALTESDDGQMMIDVEEKEV